MKYLRKKINLILLENETHSYDKDFSNNIIRDIPYLDDFTLENYIEDNKYQHWIFYFYTHNNSYKVICAVRRNKLNDVWGLKCEVFWHEFDRKKTPGTGMEYTVSINNCNGYEEFKKTTNNKLSNNPTIHTNIYNDDYGFMMTKEVVRELIKLFVEYPKIESLENSVAYDDLKKIFKDTINMSIPETMKYLDHNYPSEGQKQNLIYRLNSLDSLDNFIAIQKMNSTTEHEAFS
jgi:hypothetical protein